MTVNYKGSEIRALTTLGLGGVDITEWPVLRPEVDAIKTNIMLNAFRLAIQGGLSLLGMVDGVVDEFEDEVGIDTVQSIYQAYDAAGDLYHPERSAFPGTTAFSLTLDGGDTVGWADKTLRLVIPAAQISESGDFVQVKFEAGAAEGLAVDNAAICERDSGADGVTTPTELLFSGGSGFDIGAGASITSDALEFALDAAKDYLVILDVSSDSGKDTLASSNSGFDRYWKASADSYNAATLSGATLNASNTTGVSLIAVGVVQPSMALLSAAATAAAEPDEAHLVLFEEDVDAVTLNTDLMGWATRDDGRAFTTDFGTDDKLDLTTHGFENDDRVTVESTTTLPAGLGAGVLYYVVNKTDNDFEVSLTSGGGAVDVTDDGTGTHTVFKWAAVTLVDEGNYDTDQRILSGTLDISSHPSGTNMRWLVTTQNSKDLNLHGAGLEWK